MLKNIILLFLAYKIRGIMPSTVNYFNLTKNAYIDLYNNPSEGPAGDEPKIKGYFVCLMVKPDLNLGPPLNINKSEIDSKTFNTWNDLAWNKKLFEGLINDYIYTNLTYGGKAPSCFSSIFANKCESVSYPDVGSNSEDTLVTLDKNIFKLPVTETGVSGMTFVCRFRENEALDCLRMMTVWHKYIHAVTKGNINPRKEYIVKNIIDYKGSLYVLHLKPDFKTITMYSKYTGIYPTNIPVSAFSEEISQIQDVTFDIEFTYDKFEWLNEDIIREINYLFGNEVWGSPTLNPTRRFGNIIMKIKNSPFYHIDFNGLRERLSRQQLDFRWQAVSKLGTRFDGNKGSIELDGKQRAIKDAWFAAPLNEGMVNQATSLSIETGSSIPIGNGGSKSIDGGKTLISRSNTIGR